MTIEKVPNFSLGEQQGILFVQNTLKNNFLTNEPISPNNNIPIDSARQAETHRNFKIFSKFLSREQSGNFREKNTPLNNFSTVQPIFTGNTPIDSAKQGEQNEIVKIFIISF
jgi:hypothetical protein